MRNSVAVMYALAVTWGASALARADDIVIFNTGVGSDGKVLAAGNNDPHWTITQVPAASPFVPGSAAKVATPFIVYLPNDAVGTAGSSWLGTASSLAASFPSGT